MASIGAYDQLVTLEAPAGLPTPDGRGGYTVDWQPLEPAAWYCAIEPATQRSLEELGAGTVLAQATHIVRGWYHPGLTTQARLLLNGRILNVVYVTNRNERGIESQLVCAEVVA